MYRYCVKRDADSCAISFFEVVQIEEFVGYRISLRIHKALSLRYRFSSSYENAVDEDFRLLSAMIFYSLRIFVRNKK